VLRVCLSRFNRGFCLELCYSKATEGMRIWLSDITIRWEFDGRALFFFSRTRRKEIEMKYRILYGIPSFRCEIVAFVSSPAQISSKHQASPSHFLVMRDLHLNVLPPIHPPSTIHHHPSSPDSLNPIPNTLNHALTILFSKQYRPPPNPPTDSDTLTLARHPQALFSNCHRLQLILCSQRIRVSINAWPNHMAVRVRGKLACVCTFVSIHMPTHELIATPRHSSNCRTKAGICV
jgi:hypothetical protein